MAVGKMRHRVKIQQEVKTPDGGGGHTRSWSNVATVWAAVEPLGGREAERAQQLENPVSHRIKMRYRAGITIEHRILWGTRTFNITSVTNPDERKRMTELSAIEGSGV